MKISIFVETFLVQFDASILSSNIVTYSAEKLTTTLLQGKFHEFEYDEFTVI